MKRVLMLFIVLSIFILITPNTIAAIVYIDDFTDVDNWGLLPAFSNTTASTITSNGNVLLFQIVGTPNSNLYTSFTSDVITVNVSSTHIIQTDIPFLDFGDRSILLIQNADSTAEEYILHDQWFDIPGQLARLNTYDLASATGWSGVMNIKFRLTMIDAVYGDIADAGRLDVDWLKITSGEVSNLPGSISTTTFLPLSMSTVTTRRPTLSWTAPGGFTNNLYTLVYGKDPLFRDSTVKTLRDSVAGTNYTFTQDLTAGDTYYWTVSATEANFISGPFLQLPGVGDQRDPYNRVYPSFVVDPSAPPTPGATAVETSWEILE